MAMIIFLKILDIGTPSSITNNPYRFFRTWSGGNQPTKMTIVLVTFLLSPSYHVFSIKLFVLGSIKKSFKINAMLLQKQVMCVWIIYSYQKMDRYGGHITVKMKASHTVHCPYSLQSVGPRADPRVQAVSLEVTISHPPGWQGRLSCFLLQPA